MTVEDRSVWVYSACARLMRPLVRLALSMGLKHSQLQELLQRHLLDEADRLWKQDGVANPNVSQLSITTGMNRKLVAQRVNAICCDKRPSHEEPAAVRIFTYWLMQTRKRPKLKVLPIAGASPSFEAYAKISTKGDMHHRAVLDELIRLGIARECEGGLAELVAGAFVPSSDDKELLSFLANNGHDHLMAATENVIARKPIFLERSVFAEGLTELDCETIQRFVRKDWERTHDLLIEQMLQSVEAASTSATHRMRVGVYSYFEPVESIECTSNAQSTAKKS